MNVSIGAKTDPGRRPNNEDQLAVVDVRRHRLRADGVLVIADGMGGRNSGERASHAAVETVQDTLVEMLALGRAEGVAVADALTSALRKANARVYDLGRADETSRGMGTTCVAVVVEGERLYVGHAGDSRAYLLRDGCLLRLTDDHSYVAEQVRAGAISEESARRSRFRNVITRAVGIEPTIEPDVTEHAIQPGDVLLLCTDGLSNMVDEEGLVQTLMYAPSAQAAADKLVQTANRNGGKDNITAIVARLDLGNRTQEMRAEELARAVQPASPAENGVQELQIARRPPALHRRLPPLPLWQTLAAFLAVALVLLIGLASGFYSELARNGYHFQIAPPFVVRPPLPPPPAPPELAHMDYQLPTLLPIVPVRDEPLARNPADGSLTVISVSGQVLRLSMEGRILAKFPLPVREPPAPSPAPSAILPRAGLPLAAIASAPQPVSNLHFAVDPQGDFYIADASARRITKYRPDGALLRQIGVGLLKKPEALTVGGDGTIYVIDAGRLKVLRAQAAAPR